MGRDNRVLRCKLPLHGFKLNPLTKFSANVNADLGLSSPATSESESVSMVAEKIESDLSITPTKLNKNGVFRPIGMTVKDIHGYVFWRENDTEEWSKHSIISLIYKRISAAVFLSL